MNFFQRLSITILCFGCVFVFGVRTSDAKSTIKTQTLSKKTVDRGYTIKADDDKIKFGIKGGSFADAVKFSLSILSSKKIAPLPNDKIFLSSIYEYSFSANDARATILTPIALSLLYTSNSSPKFLYAYDAIQKKWTDITKAVDTGQRFSSKLSDAYGIIAVVGDQGIYSGRATWYRDKNKPLGAATNLFPIGTKVKVTNLDNGKTIEVEIVSTWRGRKGYVIDLVSTAFKKIAPLGRGSTRVKIEKIK